MLRYRDIHQTLAHYDLQQYHSKNEEPYEIKQLREFFAGLRISPIDLDLEPSCDELLKLSELLLNVNSNLDSIAKQSLTFLKQKSDVILETAKKLHAASILNIENFNAALSHQHPLAVADALSVLNQEKILLNENRYILKFHPNPLTLAKVLCALNKADILNVATRTMLLTCRYPLNKLVDIISRLQKANLLTANFSAVMKYAKILCIPNVQQSFLSLPDHLFTQSVIDNIHERCAGEKEIDKLSLIITQSLAEIKNQDQENVSFYQKAIMRVGGLLQAYGFFTETATSFSPAHESELQPVSCTAKL